MDEQERLQLSEIIIALQYWNRGAPDYLDEIKIGLVKENSISEKRNEYLKEMWELKTDPPFKRERKFWTLHRNGKVPPYPIDQKIWERNRIDKILRAGIGDSKRLRLLWKNIAWTFNPAPGEWEYFWQMSDELLKKDREGVGIKNHSSRPTFKNSKIII